MKEFKRRFSELAINGVVELKFSELIDEDVLLKEKKFEK